MRIYDYFILFLLFLFHSSSQFSRCFRISFRRRRRVFFFVSQHFIFLRHLLGLSDHLIGFQRSLRHKTKFHEIFRKWMWFFFFWIRVHSRARPQHSKRTLICKIFHESADGDEVWNSFEKKKENKMQKKKKKHKSLMVTLKIHQWSN